MAIKMPNKHAPIVLRKYYYFLRCKETYQTRREELTLGTATLNHSGRQVKVEKKTKDGKGM